MLVRHSMRVSNICNIFLIAILTMFPSDSGMSRRIGSCASRQSQSNPLLRITTHHSVNSVDQMKLSLKLVISSIAHLGSFSSRQFCHPSASMLSQFGHSKLWLVIDAFALGLIKISDSALADWFPMSMRVLPRVDGNQNWRT